jgi:AI-2 transport protein TqsA
MSNSDKGMTTPFRAERLATWMVILALFIFCFTYFSNFLQPIVIAIMIWYCVFELKHLLGKITIRKKQLPAWLLTIFAFLIILLISVGIFEIITLNLEMIIKKSPEYVANFKNMISGLHSLDGFKVIQERLLDRVNDFNLQPLLTGVLNSLTNIAGNVFIIVIYVAFMLAEEKFFFKKLYILIPEKEKQENINLIIGQITQSIRKYISVKTQMSLLTGILSYVVLLFFGVDFPILWAFLIFLLNYIPYIGSFFATLFPAVFAMFQFQSLWILLWVFVAIQAVQLTVGNILEPKLMGRSLNLSPLGVLIALTFWGILWGVLGMVLSVPITSVMVIIFSRFSNTKFVAVWLSETGELDT